MVKRQLTQPVIGGLHKFLELHEVMIFALRDPLEVLCGHIEYVVGRPVITGEGPFRQLVIGLVEVNSLYCSECRSLTRRLELVELIDGGQTRILIHQCREDCPKVGPLGEVPVIVQEGEVFCRI